MRAVRRDATGDSTPPEMGTTNKSVLWCHPRRGNYLATPIVIGERIGGGAEGFTASPVAANRKLYFTGEQGDVFVLDATNQFSVLATNKLGGLCLSTPAISEGTIFFRTTEKLVAVGFQN